MGPSLTTTYGNVEKVGYVRLTSKYWHFLAILVVACNFSQAYVWSNFTLLFGLEITFLQKKENSLVFVNVTIWTSNFCQNQFAQLSVMQMNTFQEMTYG